MRAQVRMMRAHIAAFVPTCTIVCVVACSNAAAPHLTATPSAPMSAAPLPAPVYQTQSLTGDQWPEYQRDDQRTGNNPQQLTITKANVASLGLKWTARTEGMQATPVVMNGIVYVADRGGFVYALTETAGAPVWTYLTIAGAAITGGPSFSNNTLFFGTRGLDPTPGTFYALSAASGQPVASYANPHPDGTFSGAPLVYGNLVFEGESVQNEVPRSCDETDQLVQLQQPSLTPVADLDLTPMGGDGADVWSAQTVDPQGYVYAATGNQCDNSSIQYANSILKLYPTTPAPLRILWAVRGHQGLNDLDFGATPTYVNGMIVEGGKNGYVYAIDAATGGLRWKHSLAAPAAGIMSGAATDGTRIYLAINQTVLRCSAGAVCGAITALDLSGNVLWSVPTHENVYGDAAFGSPAVSQGIVFASYDSGVSALDAATGALLWRYQTEHVIKAGPIVVDGGVFVGEYDGSNFYCFGPGATSAKRVEERPIHPGPGWHESGM